MPESSRLAWVRQNKEVLVESLLSGTHTLQELVGKLSEDQMPNYPWGHQVYQLYKFWQGTAYKWAEDLDHAVPEELLIAKLAGTEPSFRQLDPEKVEAGWVKLWKKMVKLCHDQQDPTYMKLFLKDMSMFLRSAFRDKADVFVLSPSQTLN